MNAMQRRMVRRVAGYRIAMFDETRALSQRHREKQETLREAQLAVLRVERRLAEITGDRFSYQSKEIAQCYLEEATEELRDARNVVADIEADFATIAARMDELQADLQPAAKLAEKVIELSGSQHEDFPGGADGMPGMPGMPIADPGRHFGMPRA